jgi:hypothetical protein
MVSEQISRIKMQLKLFLENEKVFFFFQQPHLKLLKLIKLWSEKNFKRSSLSSKWLNPQEPSLHQCFYFDKHRKNTEKTFMFCCIVIIFFAIYASELKQIIKNN